MLVLQSTQTVQPNFVPGIGEEVYDTTSGIIFKGDGYTPISSLPKYEPGSSNTALYLSGATGNYVSTPDAAPFDITGDICLMAHIKSDDYSLSQDLVTKWIGGNLSWFFGITSGDLFMYYSPNNSNVITMSPQGPARPVLIGEIWVAVTFDVDNGANGYTAKFWISSNGINWTRRGTDFIATGAPTSIYSSAANVNLGSSSDGIVASGFKGLFYEARIYNGIGDNSAPGLGTIVGQWRGDQKFNPRQIDKFGNVWTINGTGWAVGA
jgi:hypothetical protein